MAVLVEAISVLVRLETIAEKYPGGVDQYAQDCPNGTFCMDEDITRVGFMDPDDVVAFIANLEHLGFQCITDDKCDEVAVADQVNGIVIPCDWLEHLYLVLFEGDVRVFICKIADKPLGEIVFPAGWNYEASLSKRFITVKSEDVDKRMKFLRHEDGVDFYLDTLTGQEVFIEQTIRRTANGSMLH
jgi:hypothetical protein